MDDVDKQIAVTLAKTADLVPYVNNARLHSVEQIAQIVESIEQFGFVNPILVDGEGVLIAGHGRLLAAQELGLEDVPVISLPYLTQDQARALALADNQIALNAGWDEKLLAQELGELRDAGYEINALGFSPDDLTRLFNLDKRDDEAEDDSFEPAEQAKLWIQRGDVIQLGRHRVVCGDSSQEATIASLLGDSGLDMLITDPPYGVKYVGPHKEKPRDEIENDDLDEAALSKLWADVTMRWLERLSEGSPLYASIPAGPLSMVFMDVWKRAGILRQQLIWVKDSMVLGRSDYHYKHEPIMYGWKPGAAHFFIDDRTKTSVFEIKRPKASPEHPTMKPVELWGELIANSSKPGALIGDPFLGSGTTLIACEQLGRTCLGVELNPGYCQVIIERYHAFKESRGEEITGNVNGRPLKDVLLEVS